MLEEIPEKPKRPSRRRSINKDEIPVIIHEYIPPKMPVVKLNNITERNSLESMLWHRRR